MKSYFCILIVGFYSFIHYLLLIVKNIKAGALAAPLKRERKKTQAAAEVEGST